MVKIEFHEEAALDPAQFCEDHRPLADDYLKNFDTGHRDGDILSLTALGAAAICTDCQSLRGGAQDPEFDRGEARRGIADVLRKNGDIYQSFSS